MPPTHSSAETFLPSQLAILLSILSATLPASVPNESWYGATTFVLDEMVRKKNGLARLRRPPHGHDMPDASACPTSGEVRGYFGRIGHGGGGGKVSEGGLEAQDFGPAWEAVGGVENPLANCSQILELAEQLETGDLLSFFFEPHV